MFDRYTDPAKRIIFFARVEANHRLEQQISPADILMGIVRERDSRALRIAPLQENVLRLRYLVRIPHLPITSMPYPDTTREIPLDRSAKMVLGYASYEADREGQYWIDADHLLRALLRFENPAGEAVKDIGLELKTLRTAAAQDRSNIPSAPVPDGVRWKPGWNRWMARLIEYF